MLRTTSDEPHKIRTDCLQAQHPALYPEIITVIPVVASVPARALALPPPIGDHFMLSMPLHHRCQHCQVPLPGLSRVPAPHLLQDMNLNGNRRGRRKPMFGVLHRRVEPSFRTMVNFRVVTRERLFQLFQLFQRLFSPSRFLGNQRTHHPHTWHRETDNRFQSYETVFYRLTPYSCLDAKELARFFAGNDKEEVVVFHGQIDSFFRVSHAALPSYPYSTLRVLTILCPILIGIFFYHTLHHKRLSTYLCTSAFSLFSFSRTKGYTRAALSYSTMITMTHTSRVTRCSITKH